MTTFDFSDSFTSLLKLFTCTTCNNLYEDPVKIGKCNHVFCSKCVVNLENCPICDSSIVHHLLQQKESTKLIVDKIKNIRRFFETSEAKYMIANLPLNILDKIKQLERIEDKSENQSDKPSDLQEAEKILDISNLNKENSFFCYDIDMSEVKIISKQIRRNPKGETPLHVACSKNSSSKLGELVKSGVDVNIKDFANWTALHDAVHNNAYDCAQILLNAGAVVNAPGENYITPLYQAVDLHLPEMCSLLLSYGAEVNCEDYTGKKLLNLATTSAIGDILENPLDILMNKKKYFINPVTNVLYKGDNKIILKQLTCLGLKVHKKFQKNDNNIDLFIVGNNEELTYNTDVLMSIINSVMVIYEKDLETFVSVGHPLQIKLIPEEIRTTLTKSIYNNLLRNPRLFDGMNFFIIGRDKFILMDRVKIMKEDLAKLLTMAGGKILARAPAERTVDNQFFYPFHLRNCEKLRKCCNYIIYNEKDRPGLLYNLPELKHVTAQWIIKCIWNFNIDF